jgi:hypothetical protein
VPDDPASGLRGVRLVVLLHRKAIYAVEPFAAACDPDRRGDADFGD